MVHEVTHYYKKVYIIGINFILVFGGGIGIGPSLKSRFYPL